LADDIEKGKKTILSEFLMLNSGDVKSITYKMLMYAKTIKTACYLILLTKLLPFMDKRI